VRPRTSRGAHSFKFGYVGGYLVEDIQNHGNDLNLAYTFNNGVPPRSRRACAPSRRATASATTALYAQDQWTMGKLTLQGCAALRPRVELLAAADDRPGPHRRQTFLSTPLSYGVPTASTTRTSRRAAHRVGRVRQRQDRRQVHTGKYEDPASNLNNNYSISNPARAYRDEHHA